MIRVSRLLLVLLLVALTIPACRKEKAGNEDSFKFVVYPGAKYLPHLTEKAKEAHRIFVPSETEPPPTAIYETAAGVDDVAQFYVKDYGYESIAPDATNNLSAAKPPAYRRSGDLQADAKAIAPVMEKLKLNTDISRAIGTYNAVEIAPKPNRPRVTISRPYFDATSSQVVDRTLIVMSR